MQAHPKLRAVFAGLLVLSTLFGCLVAPPAPAAAQQAVQDWDIANGHFFTQTGKGNQSGFSISDDNGVLFWREFQRLGGVNVLGYPVSRRFLWNGFVCQAMQRVVLQWRADSQSVSFVNVFDMMNDTGKNEWLESVRQTPKPKAFNETGLAWEQIVQLRLRVLDANPAIKQAYFNVVGDPVTMNGLPTTEIVDMGDSFIVRAQRVVIQQWKQDVPWAKQGQVTFGLGGSIALEAGLLPVTTAGEPEILVVNNEKKFRAGYPYNWHQLDAPQDWTAIWEANSVDNGIRAGIAMDISQMQSVISPEQAAAALNSQSARDRLRDNSKLRDFYVEVPRLIQFGDRTYVKQVYGGSTEQGSTIKEARYVFFIGTAEYWFSSGASADTFARHEGTFDWIVATVQQLP
ncbi:MAG: hypothetical protein ACYC4L_07895 [Chloroflexota bacterium]